MSSVKAELVENADIDRDTPQPEIHIEERRLKLLDFCKTAIKVNGSDIHLQAGSIPMIRVDGRARFLDCPPLTDEDMKEYVDQIMDAQAEPAEKKHILEHKGSVDVAYGKSTSLAAIIGQINRSRAERIITVEDPVEFQHENAKSLVSQVEVGTDSESYEHALRAMMRQDPDTILVGEIRDTFSLTTALRAADTGHLVFTTVHATNAPMTIERLVSLFEPAQKELQQTQLGLNLNAVICQRLAKKRDGKGRVPVVEIMVATPLVRKYIIEGEFEKLKGTVGNREAGSQSFDQHLTELFMKQIIDVSEAKRLASNVDALNLALRGITNSDTRLR